MGVRPSLGAAALFAPTWSICPRRWNERLLGSPPSRPPPPIADGRASESAVRPSVRPRPSVRATATAANEEVFLE